MTRWIPTKKEKYGVGKLDNYVVLFTIGLYSHSSLFTSWPRQLNLEVM